MRRWAALVAAGMLLAGAPAAGAATPRVVGGTTAPTPGWMTQVWVGDGGSSSLCGGELVSARWVLTAAHCVRGAFGFPVLPGDVRVRVGEPVLAPPTDENPGTAVEEVRIDPDNTAGSTAGDVALLRLGAPSPATPVAIGEAGQAPVGAAAAVLGWGVTGSGTTSRTLQQVGQTVIDAGRCGIYGADFRPDSMVCAGGQSGQDSCNGDSGGPLALDATGLTATLIGTVDFGSDTCGDGTPAVYQRVTEGATAGWLRTVLVRPVITPSTTTPAAGALVRFTAASGWGDAAFTWDLDGDGAFDDAAGAAVSGRAPAVPRTVSVLARTAAGDDAAVARVPLTPVDPGVTVSAPATVREGGQLLVSAVSRGAAGTLTVGGAGLAAGPRTVTLAAAGSGTLALAPRDDRIWNAPRTLTLTLRGSDGLVPSPARLSVRVTDDDTPRLTAVRVGVTRTGASVRARVPGRGRLRVLAEAGGRTVASRTVTVTSARTVSATLPLTAAQRARRPQIRLRWTSSAMSTATASAARRLPAP